MHAAYPGTFDPITLGHLDLIRRTARLFERVTILVAAGHHKTTLLTREQRLSLVRASLREAGLDHCEAVPFSGLAVEACAALGVGVMVRGLRDGDDWAYEARLALVNRQLAPELETLFLPTSPQWAAVSSSAVRELLRYGRDLSAWVPPAVVRALKSS